MVTRNHNRGIKQFYRLRMDCCTVLYKRECKHCRGCTTWTGYFKCRARICRSFKETRYRFSAWRAGTKPYLSYWPASLHRLAKSIPRNRCLGSINVYKFGLWEVKTGFYRNRSMQTGSSGTLIGWKSGQTTFVPLWDRMEGAWLRTPDGTNMYGLLYGTRMHVLHDCTLHKHVLTAVWHENGAIETATQSN